MFPIRTYLYLRRPKIYNYVVSMVQLRRPRGIAANDPWIFQPDSMASVLLHVTAEVNQFCRLLSVTGSVIGKPSDYHHHSETHSQHDRFFRWRSFRNTKFASRESIHQISIQMGT